MFGVNMPFVSLVFSGAFLDSRAGENERAVRKRSEAQSRADLLPKQYECCNWLIKSSRLWGNFLANSRNIACGHCMHYPVVVELDFIHTI